jgi:Family of unknown function (DUF5722)
VRAGVLLALLAALAFPAGAAAATVTASADTITVRGEASGPAELHELAAYETAPSGPPLAGAPAGEYEFELPRYQGGRDRAYSKFLVTGDGPARHVTDLPSQRDFAFPQPATKKGLQVQMVDDAEELGIGHAGINLALDQYLYRTEVPGDTIAFESGGRTFHFRAGAVRALDRQVKALSDNGVLVNLILILYDNPRQNSPNDVLMHPDAARGHGTVYAFNTKTAEGVAHFTAAMEFFTERYTRPDQRYGRAVGFIVGNEVDAQWVWQNMGEKTAEAFMEDYARTVRLTWIAARKAYARARVYISLTHFWAQAFAAEPLRYYPGRQVIDLMEAISARGGDFPWHVAQHPYPEDLFDPAFWHDTTATDSFDTPRITFKNLDVLTRYLDPGRRIILSEQGFHTPSTTQEDERLQAAAYALAYYKVRFLDRIDSFILHRHVDHKQEGGLRLGLWTWDEDRPQASSPGARKHLYEVFRDIDTDRSLAATEFAKPVIGIQDWAELVPGFDPGALADRDPPHLAGTRLVRRPHGARPLDGWQPAENATAVTPDGRVQFAALAKLWRGADVRLDAPLDARARPYLTAALDLPAEAYEAKVKVYAGERVAEGVAVLDGGGRFALDLRGWPGLASVERVKVWVRADGNADWSGSYGLEQVAFASGIVPAGGRANLQLEASAASLRPGAPLTVEVTNHDARALRGEIALQPSDTLRVAEPALDVDGHATGERRRFTLRIEAASGSRPRLRFRHRGETRERPVALPAGGIVLYDFEDGTEGWSAGGNVVGVSQQSRFANAPGAPRLGRYVLAVQGADVPADAWRTVRVDAPQPIDLRAGPFFAHVNGYGGVPGATYEARVELTAGSGDVLTRTVAVHPDSWNRVEVDTPGWAGAGAVVGIEISYRAVGNPMVWRSQFQVDFVGLEGA